MVICVPSGSGRRAEAIARSAGGAVGEGPGGWVCAVGGRLGRRPGAYHCFVLPGQRSAYLPGSGSGQRVEHVLRRPSALQRVLAHTGKSIDDVVNCPISRQTVLGYFKLSRFIDRQAEVSELERQWNPLGLRG